MTDFQPTVVVGADERATGVFSGGHEDLTAAEREALSPRTLWRHRSAVGMREPLIMMVDDELLNIEMTQAFLSEAGYTRFAHTDKPEEAVAMMKRQVPGILLLDLSMPKVGGLEILTEMRNDPLLRHVPVIVLTSSTEPEFKLGALSLGANDFLSKPVDASELALRIRNTLASSAFREYLSQHDSLTGLPNKLQYRKAAGEVLEQAMAAGGSGAFIHLGVDRLGRINDTLGRAAGDRLLQRLAKRLASCVQTEADGELSSETQDPTLYRFDGDEFAIVIPQLASVQTVASFINKLLQDATLPFGGRGAPELLVTCAAGVSVFPADGTSADALMRNAGLALRQAKQAGPNRCEFFTPALKDQAVKQMRLGPELLQALRKGRIELMYTPRLDLASGQLAGAQAELRWNHESGRSIKGDALLDMVDSAETHEALLAWLLEQLASDASAWRAGGLQAPRVSVKASLTHLPAQQLASTVEDALANGLDAANLTLDLKPATAPDAVSERDWTAVGALRARGVRLCLDGFGLVGTVAHLRRLPFDALKVDRSFLRDFDEDAAAGTMLLAIGDMAQRLRVPCIAAGVDQGSQAAFLRRNQWQLAEGRAVGPSLPAAGFAASWLPRRVAAAA